MTWSRAGSPLHLIIGMGVWIPHWWCSLEFDGTKHLQPSTLVFNCNSRTRGKSCTQKLRNTLLYGYIQMDFTKCPIVGHLGSFKIFCYVNSVTVNILYSLAIIIFIGEMPMSGMAGDVKFMFIILLLHIIQLPCNLYPPPSSAKRVLFPHAYVCSECFIFSLISAFFLQF